MKHVIITGGSSGIGREIAYQLAAQGNVIYVTGRDEQKLRQTVHGINSKGGTGHYGIADVTKSEEVKQVFTDALEKMSHVDVIVANAGAGRFKNLEEFTDEDYDIQFDTNVKGVFFFLREAVIHFRERDSGQVIVTSSNLGLKTSARCGLYAGTKHALQAMVGALREELKGTPIKAATINPGSVNTPWFDGKDVNRSKMLEPEDVAAAVMLIINQSESSDIDHILLLPGRT